MKLQHIAAAVALAVAGSANAAVDNFGTGNGGLFLIAFDNAGGSYTSTSTFIDLGYNLSDFAVGSALTGVNQQVVWNFGSNTVTVNGSAANLGTNAWDVAFDKLLANADAGQIKWTIGAGDTTGNGTNVNYLVTGLPTNASLTAQNATNTGSMSLANAMYTGLTVGTGKGTILSADNGAFTFAAADGLAATSANGYVIATSAFGTNWQGKDVITNSITTGAKNNLWQLKGDGSEAQVGVYTLGANDTITNASTLVSSPAQVAGTYAGTFTFDTAAKTLTWETAAITTVTPAVPEASSYALALTGLVLAGVAARRRRAA